MSPVTDAKASRFSKKFADANRQGLSWIDCGGLPAVPNGSLWEDGECVEYRSASMGSEERLKNAHVPLNPSIVEVLSYVPRRMYPLGRGMWQSKRVLLPRENGPDLIVPMMELVRFYYALSSPLSHAVFSGYFDTERIFDREVTALSSVRYNEQERRLALRLRKNHLRSDGWVVGRVLRSPLAMKRVKRTETPHSPGSAST